MLKLKQRRTVRYWENSEVEITYPSRDELDKLDYRSKKELTGQVRLDVFRAPTSVHVAEHM